MEERVDSLLHRMSLDDKLALLGGERGFYTHAVPSIGLPSLRMSDGPYGVRTFGPSTAYAAGVSLAAAWDPELAMRVGQSMGRDARARGVNVLLAPGVNLYRSPLNGRNFEYFGEDPYLASRIAVGFIEGVQGQGVVATVKHFIANNSEFDRHNLNAEIDERTLRELYLPPFEASVREAHVGAVMDSYNLFRGKHLTENGPMNNTLLKQEWGFDGLVMSDWGATYSTLGAANGGLDLEMSGGHYMNPSLLKQELANGTVSLVTIDDKVRRILRTAVRFGFLDREQWDPAVSQFDAGGDAVAYEAALGSITLLRNEGGVLPLSAARMKTIAVIGPDAQPPTTGGGGSSQVTPFESTSIVQALAAKLGRNASVLYARGVLTPAEVFSQAQFASLTHAVYANEQCTGRPLREDAVSRIADFRTSNYSLANFPVATERRCEQWTGDYIAPVTGRYTVLAEAVLRDAYSVELDGKVVLAQKKSEDQSPNSMELSLGKGQRLRLRVRFLPDTNVDRLGVGILPTRDLIAPEVDRLAQKADAVVVAAGYAPESEGESHDRTFALPYGQVALIERVAAQNKRTIVAVASGGGYDTAEWLDRVPALVEDWYFGQEGGRALVDVLFGHSPEGRLPMTWERRLDDNPTYSTYYPERENATPPSVHYSEGVFLGYRYYTTQHKPTLYPFGYGLTYTKFRLRNLHVTAHGDAHAPHVTVSFDVTNTGSREGAEVAQVYIGATSPSVPRPLRELKGFRKVWLKSGENRHVTLTLDGRAFAFYDVEHNQWKTEPGQYTVEVGESSENIALRTAVMLH